MKIAIKMGAAGGRARETLLWTNSATAAKSSIECTLSDSLRNYTSVKVVYSYNSTSEAAYENTYKLFRDETDGTLADYYHAKGNSKQRLGLVLNSGSGNIFVRGGYVDSDTKIIFGSAYRANATKTDNNLLIPHYIYGVK